MSLIPRVAVRDVIVAAAAAALLLPVLTPRLYASDEIQYFSYLRSLWFDRDLSFENEYRALLARGVAVDSGFADTNLTLTTATGLRPNFGTIGSAILWSPFYAAGDAIARVMRRAGREIAVDGYSRPYIVAIAIGSVIYGLLALVLAAASARALFGRATAASAIVLIGTPLFFYMCIAPGFAHATSAFAVSLFVFVWLRVRQSWRTPGLVALAATAGLMAMVREQDAFLIIGPVLDIVRAMVRRLRPGNRFEPAPRLPALAAAVIAGAITVLPQVWAYLVLNGRPGPSPLVSRKMSWHAPHASGVLFSPEHGFLFWTPLALLAIVGLLSAALRRPSDPIGAETRWIAVLALVMVASQVYVAGSVESWTVAGSFGQRRFIALTPLLVLGLASLITVIATQPRGLRLAVHAVIALCIWWNLGLMAQFGLHTMDRQRLTLRHNVWQTFMVLPREAPAVAYRYFTNRASFYGRDRQ